MVEKAPPKFVTSVYRKSTFTGQYISWNCFSPQKWKTNLISTLTHRTLSICSPEKLQDELDIITSILLNNGYPEHDIKTSISKKNQQFNAPVKFGPEKCPVYLRLPYIGSTSTKFEKQIKTAIKTCFVGRTSQRLQDRIKQHIPKSIRNTTCSQTHIQTKRNCKSSTQLPTT